jgi:hypothetical protein
MKANGKTTTWRVLVSINGVMAVNMKVSIKRIRSTGMEFISGLMAESTWAIGLKASKWA